MVSCEQIKTKKIMISKEEYKKAKEIVKKYEQEQLNIPVVSERKIVRCKDPMVCLRGCSVRFNAIYRLLTNVLMLVI